MTLLVAHRRNTPDDLAATPVELGVEMDVRSGPHGLVVTHDAFTSGCSFEEWLRAYRHAFVVVNVKEEGLETAVEEHLDRHGVEQWAYLDQSFPFLVRTLRRGEQRCMVRVSEYESVETALALPVRPQWVWLDSFSGSWPAPDELGRLQDAGFRVMLVSPELQGRDPKAEVDEVRSLFAASARPLDAVCTKVPELWR